MDKMGRLDQVPNYALLTEDGYDNGLKDIVKDFKNKETKILIIDADSIIHAAVHPRKEENRSEYTEYEVDTIVIPKIKEKLFEINNAVSEGFNIQKVYCFVGGKGSYRKELYPLYKANRTEKLAILGKVYDICRNELNFISVDPGYEADDFLSILNKEYADMSILSYIDKDLDQISNSTVYNYNKKYWYKINEEEARYNLAVQVGIGDASDNVIANKGLGKAKIKKYITLGMTDYQYIKGLIKAYRNYNKEVEDIKPLIRMTYKLVSLGKIYTE